MRLVFFALYLPYRNKEEIDRATKELREKFKSDIETLKIDLKTEIEANYKLFYSKNTDKIKEEFRSDVEKVENVSNYYAKYIQAISMISLDQPYSVYNNFLASSIYAIKLDDHIKLDSIIKNLNKMKNDGFVIDRNKINIDKRLTLDQFKEEVNNLTKNNSNIKVLVDKIFQLADDILLNNQIIFVVDKINTKKDENNNATENPRQGSD